MARPILVGDDPCCDDHAPIHFGVAASRYTGAPLVIGAVHADEEAVARLGHGQVEDDLRGEGQAPRPAGAGVVPDDVPVDVRALPGTSPARALHEAAEQLDAAMLVVGSTRKAKLGRVLRGSTAERLLHGAPCPVAVVPNGWQPKGRMEVIGVAYADTPEGHDALRGALALARRSGARLRVLSAAKPQGYSQMQGGGSMVEATTFEEIGSALRVAAERGVAEATAGAGGVEIEPDVSVQDPGDFLVAASAQVDLMIIGSRGYGPRRAVLLGGVSRRVTAESHCPVIVLPRGVESVLEALIDEHAGATA